MTSLCDKCFAPGQCCRQIVLFNSEGIESSFWFDDGLHSVLKDMERRELPFVPRSVRWQAKVDQPDDPDHGRPYAGIVFSCPSLLPNGRCGIYDERPNICRNFEPASTELCVHWRGAEAGAL